MSGGSEGEHVQTERERSLELLQAQHAFPGPFGFRVVVSPSVRAEVLTAVSAISSVSEVDERPSRNGTYVALRIRVVAASAEEVLEVYDILKKIDGVRAVL
jgi:putative lipoic acid-binding regulatory protein